MSAYPISTLTIVRMIWVIYSMAGGGRGKSAPMLISPVKDGKIADWDRSTRLN